MKDTKIVIVGAGITGLVLAFRLSQNKDKAFSVVVIEQSSQVGGWICTKQQEGFLFECGPRSLRALSFPLAEELSLASELIEVSSSAKEKYIVYKGALERVPNTLFDLFFSPLGRVALKGLLLYPFRRMCAKRKKGDETVAEYVASRFGRPVLDVFVNPLVTGIYATDPARLSFRSCFGRRKKGAKLFSFKGGMQTLPEKLACELKGKVRLSERVSRVVEKESSVVVVTDKETIECDHVVFTQSLSQVAAMLPSDDPLCALLPCVLQSSVTQVLLGWHDEVQPLPGFGFLVPSVEEKELLGVIFDSNVFREQNGPFKTRLSVMMGTRGDLLLEGDEETLKEKALHFCRKFLGITKAPDQVAIFQAKRAIPCYPVGFEKAKDALVTHLKERKVSLAGAAVDGVALGDCIESAEKMAAYLAQKYQT